MIFICVHNKCLSVNVSVDISQPLSSQIHGRLLHRSMDTACVEKTGVMKVEGRKINLTKHTFASYGIHLSFS